MMLQGKAALITGAAQGIGKAIALLFAKEGCDVAFTDVVAGDKAMATRREIEQQGVRCLFYEGDASDFASAHDIVEKVHSEWGKIDILVNNVGITRDGLMLRMSEQSWDDVIQVNLKSAFNFIHAVSPYMLRQKSGSIISMSSIVGMVGNSGQANYAASKAGIIALTQSVAQELGSRNIRANAIAPGYVLTEMTEALPEEVKQDFIRRISLRRGAQPEEVAKVALFLASDMSSYISGQVIRVDGAMS